MVRASNGGGHRRHRGARRDRPPVRAAGLAGDPRSRGDGFPGLAALCGRRRRAFAAACDSGGHPDGDRNFRLDRPVAPSCFRVPRSPASCATAAARSPRQPRSDTRSRASSSWQAPTPASPTPSAPSNSCAGVNVASPSSKPARSAASPSVPRHWAALHRRSARRSDQYQQRTADHHRRLSLGRSVVSVSGRLKQLPAEACGHAAAMDARQCGAPSRCFDASREGPRSAMAHAASLRRRRRRARCRHCGDHGRGRCAGASAARHLPEWLILIFDHITEFGKSFWLLVPVAFALGAIALAVSPALPRCRRACLPRSRCGSAFCSSPSACRASSSPLRSG